MKTVVHVTHEAVVKIGGIGAVLHGLLTARSYITRTDRNILVQPLWDHGCPAKYRLGDDGEVEYSGLDGIASSPFTDRLRQVESTYGTPLVYGRRKFVDPESGQSIPVEILLIDVQHANPHFTGIAKFKMFERFGINSQKYEHIWDYEQWVRIAEPTLAAVQAVGAMPQSGQCVVVSHEFMGMPTALCAAASDAPQLRTVFYAHEVATMRRICEGHAGHDTSFYNVLRLAAQEGKYVSDVYGDQFDYYKHALVNAVPFMDCCLCVGDYVVDEMKFMGPHFRQANLKLTYNGIHAWPVTVQERRAAKGRLQQYAENLLGYRPDYIFTHVTRLVPSKGLWRDLRVMEQLDSLLGQLGKTAALFVLSTEMPAKSQHDIERMEAGHKWPTAHREGWGDLSGGEANFYVGVQDFNTRARNTACVFFNQFGWSRERLGKRCPADMTMWDIRKGSDVEFGQSIYEPYGIAQVEALAFGAICVIGSPCGCAGHAIKIIAGRPSKNVIIADYVQVPGTNLAARTIGDYLALSRDQRDAVETYVAAQLARQILENLPKSPAEEDERLKEGYDIGGQMNWDQVARDYVLPAIEEICDRPARKATPGAHEKLLAAASTPMTLVGV